MHTYTYTYTYKYTYTVSVPRVVWPGHLLLTGNAVRLSKVYTTCAKMFQGLDPLGRTPNLPTNIAPY